MATAKEIFDRSDMVMHVKEPLPAEYDMIWENQIVFTYLHLAAAQELTHALVKSKAICIAYETIQKADRSLPLLTPMSEVAGRMAIQQGAKYLEMAQGGHGILLGGVPGVDPGNGRRHRQDHLQGGGRRLRHGAGVHRQSSVRISSRKPGWAPASSTPCRRLGQAGKLKGRPDCRDVLLGGLPGVDPGRVLIIGGAVAGVSWI